MEEDIQGNSEQTMHPKELKNETPAFVTSIFYQGTLLSLTSASFK